MFGWFKKKDKKEDISEKKEGVEDKKEWDFNDVMTYEKYVFHYPPRYIVDMAFGLPYDNFILYFRGETAEDFYLVYDYFEKTQVFHITGYSSIAEKMDKIRNILESFNLTDREVNKAIDKLMSQGMIVKTNCLY